MADIKVRPATVADIEAFYGFRWPHTMRALVAVQDDQPLGVIGLSREGAYQKLFSDTKPGLPIRSMAVLRAVQRVMQWVRESPLPVVAVADNPALIERLGFEQIAEDEYQYVGPD